MDHVDFIQLEPVWNAADALKQYVLSLNLTEEEKHLLLETVFFELRILYLQEDLVSGYDQIEGMDDEFDRLIDVFLDAMEGLYEMNDVLDLEAILEHLKTLWLSSSQQENSQSQS